MNLATAKWTRSSFCADGTCVEVAVDGDTILVRDGKNTGAQHLEFTRPEWHQFLDQVRAGRFNG